MAVRRNERGYRIGESHHRATHSDAEVREVLRLSQQTRWGWRRVAAHTGLPANWVKAVLAGRYRLSVPMEGPHSV